MKKEDLKPGYVLEGVKDQDMVSTFVKVEINSDGELCVSSPVVWFPMYDIDDDLECYNGFRINKVYGRSSNKNAYKLSPEGRELLWERKNVDLKQIKKELGRLLDAMRRVLEEAE